MSATDSPPPARETPSVSRRLYRGQPIDNNVPPIPPSQLLSIPSSRPGRRLRANPVDPHPYQFFGDPIIQKEPQTIRVFFQNIKGLTYSSSKEDYSYLMSCIRSLEVDLSGFAETNSCWSHPHIAADFRSIVRRFYPQNKVLFGSPTPQLDPIPLHETFQAGGNATIVTGSLVSRVHNGNIIDPTGLGRWNGVTLRGSDSGLTTIITGYRVCAGSKKSSSLGSAYSREHEFFRSTNNSPSHPRRAFLNDLKAVITDLQSKEHSIILMLDANATLESDRTLSDFVQECSLYDLHESDPAPSTYVGADSRRIDYIFGCIHIKERTVRSGTLSYFEGPQSDHRGLFIDIKCDHLQSKSGSIKPIAERFIHSGNPELVAAYNQTVLKYYEEHRMVDRIDNLFKNFKHMTREAIRSELQKWDNDQGRAMTSGEKILSRPPKKYAWSPVLRNAAILRMYWKLRLREHTHNSDYQETFRRWQQRVKTQDPSFKFPHLDEPFSPSQVRAHFNRATAVFRACQKASTPLRVKSYCELLEKYSEDRNPDTVSESRRKAKIVQKTIDGEIIRSHFQSLRRVVKPNQTRALSKILVPRLGESPVPSEETYRVIHDSDPQSIFWETVVERDDMERHLLHYNRESFRAAAESPCGNGILFDAMTFSSLSPASSDLLAGEFPSEWHGDDEIMKAFLASFTIPQEVHAKGEIPSDISADDILKGFSSWKESTSTSPSGRHLGHYKSIIQEPTLLQCLVKFMNIAIQSGISIPRWSNAITVLIEKDPGQPRLNRLRIIHLFEADLNLFLKLQWGKRLVHRALDLNLLHSGQHGSIPGRNTLNPIMLMQLTTDLCRILKHDFVRFDNDASACYDRIIIALGMLAARKCGMPDHAIRTHSDALEFMRYKVKTIFGISSENYQGTPFEPLFGTGQGSGASPAVWLTLVVILLQTLDRLIPDRMSFTSIQGDLDHSRLTDAFVDDTSMGFNSQSDDTTLEDLISRLQKIAQTWEHLLYLSGGTLNLGKCSWYAIRWEWEKGRPVIRPVHPDDPNITLHQGSNLHSTTEITRSDPSTSGKMLGVLLNPMGDFSDHIKAMKKKADSFASRILSPRLKANDIRTFHRSIYTPSMRYGLAALAVDEEVLSNVQSRVIKSMLQKMNVQSTIPTAIRHGPPELGGLAIYDLRTEAGIEAVKFFRDAVYSRSECGKLLLLNLQYSQLEAGIGEALLEHPEIHISYITPSWILSLRQFLFCHNMTITVSNGYIPPLKSETDQYIMQAPHLARYTAVQQRDINLVRLYLQVTSLADLSDHTKNKGIHLNYLDGVRPSDWVNNDRWPRQQVPTSSQKRLWKNYIRSSFLRYVPYWKVPPLPPRAIPDSASTGPTHTSHEDLSSYIRDLPPRHRRLLDSLEQVATDLQVWKAFRSKSRIHVASDGGLHKDQGTFGWIISTKNRVLFKCSGPVDGPFDTNSSTRCELCGVTSSLLLLVTLSRFWGIKHRCRYRWYCDSKAAISRIQRFASPRSRVTSMPFDADLISMIVCFRRELRCRFQPVWVKGHQDTLQSYDHLPISARLNVDADYLATRYRQRGRLKSSAKIQHEPTQQCSISVNGVRLTGQYDACIRYHVNGYHLRQYLQEKNNWSDSVWNDIDFATFGNKFRSLRPSRQVLHMKIVHNQLPLGTRRYQQSSVKDDILRQCPCCKNAQETQEHFIRCPSNPKAAAGIQSLTSSLSKDPHHPVGRLLVAGVKHWVSQQPESFKPDLRGYPPHMIPLIETALTNQDRIGWHQALKGFLSKSWTELATMDLHNPAARSDSSGTRRLAQLVQTFFIFSQTIWSARNEVLHSTDSETLANIRSTELAEIRYYMQHPMLLSFADRHLCEWSLEKLTRSSASTRRRWLTRVKLSCDKATRDGSRQPLITSFFGQAS